MRFIYYLTSLKKFKEDINFFKKCSNRQYIVCQTGSLVKSVFQIGQFDVDTVKEMSQIAKDNGILLKEHNCDYLNNDEILLAQLGDGLIVATSADDHVILNNKNVSVAKDVAQIMTFKTGGWGEPYPHSLLGIIAFIRQSLLDAKWYGRSTEIIEKFPAENEPLSLNPSLAALEEFRANHRPMLFKTREEHGVLRALKIANEFNLNPWIYGSGFEYRRLDKITTGNPFIILPLEFPSKPKVTDPYIALQYSTEQLKHCDMASDNFKKIYDFSIRV